MTNKDKIKILENRIIYVENEITENELYEQMNII